ncbi:MAG TPA: class I SAM-dependent methyltransferase, partial [Microlunatus sp.]|nr:class I SAM-dependent methyltransferase [Microlunatus sp.]
FTRDGLEQATRPVVAAHHAARLLAGGVERVVDLGCGIGADAMAFLAAGIDVEAVELDPATAQVAAANLSTVAGPGRGTYAVEVADAETFRPVSREPWAWFADPARRDRTGRVWRLADFSPRWEVLLELLGSGRVAGVKLGPGLPHTDIPAGVEAEWVSHAGTTLEAALWVGGSAVPGARRATVLSDAGPVSLLLTGDLPTVEVGPIRRFVYEPDGAVIRSGAIPLLAEALSGTLVEAKIAYLTSDRFVPSPFARAYEVLERLPYNERRLRDWLRRGDIGTVEIKQRGIDLDPAQLRRRLAPRGSGSATLLITRTPQGATVLVVRRVAVL